ncbi:MAG: GAF domain-containing protein [Chloroflexi bacterium]|nr:GAF domain-containing protein [Chloroflexota bacterium]
MTNPRSEMDGLLLRLNVARILLAEEEEEEEEARIVVSLLDVTEQKKAEEQLRLQSAALNAAANAIIITDRDGAIEWINPAFTTLTGYSAAEAIGKNPRELVKSGKHSPEFYKDLWDTILAGKVWRGECINRRKNGSLYNEEQTITPLRDTDGEISHLIAIKQDITERKRAETEIKHNAARTEALLHVAARLNTQLELDALLHAICEETQRALNVPAAALYLYDTARDALIIAADCGLPREFRASHRPTPRAQYEAFARRMGAVNTIPDAQAVPDLPNADLVRALDIRTIAGATLLRDEELVGALSIYTFGAAREFSADDLELLKGIADQAALAIHNARLFAETRQRAQQLGLLYDAGLTLNRELDPHVQMEFLLKLAAKTIGADLAEFFAFDPATQSVAFQFGVGHPDEMFAPLRALGKPITDENSLIAWVCRQRLPLNVPDVAADPRYVVVDPKTRAGLWVPILHEAQLRGVIGMLSSRLNAFSPQDERLLILFANQAAVAMENARLLEETQERARQLQALHEIDHAITASMDLHLTLDVLLSQVIEQLRVDAADVLLLDPHSHALTFAAGRGFHTRALEHTRLRLGEGYAGRVALDRRVYSIPNLAEADGFIRAPLLAGEDFVAYCGVPLIAKGQVRGVLEIFQRARWTPDSNWQFFAKALAEQAALAIQDAELFNNLERSNAELIAAYDATIEGWSHALDLRDQTTEGHTQRAAEMTLRLARACGIADESLVHLRRGALLHDIGKMGIPDAILLKPGALTDAEWEIMRRHPTYAYEMLAPIAYLKPALDIPYCHHEKWDGAGYPRGLRGEEIPLSARIFALVDVWDALTSHRPYRAAWSAEQAREHIRDQAGKHFDPAVVEKFLELVAA